MNLGIIARNPLCMLPDNLGISRISGKVVPLIGIFVMIVKLL